MLEPLFGQDTCPRLPIPLRNREGEVRKRRENLPVGLELDVPVPTIGSPAGMTSRRAQRPDAVQAHLLRRQVTPC